MKKKILSAVLALIMCLGIFPAVVSAETGPKYLKDMLGTLSGTYVFNNTLTFGDTIQDGTAILTLNENELSFETIVVYRDTRSKTSYCGIASKFRFDETGYNDWNATTFDDGKPQYNVEGGLDTDCKIGDLLEETEVISNKNGGYYISVFGMMSFDFFDIVDGKAQKANCRGVELERNTGYQMTDSIITITTVAAPTLITADTTEWSGWMIADGKIEILNGVTLTGDTNIILADGAELIVNGTINCNGYLLNIYVQNTEADAGTFTVIGTTQEFEYAAETYYGIDGDITVNGGIVNITGGEKDDIGHPGICGKLTVTNGDVTVTGGSGFSGVGAGIKGGVTVSGGKTVINGGKSMNFRSQNDKDNAPGIMISHSFDEIYVSGGELNVNGSGNGYGVDGLRITVEGGKAVINGGKDGGKAYIGQWNREWINAYIEASNDGVIYYPFDNNKYSDHVPADAVSIRLTAITTVGIEGDENPTSPKTGDTNNMTLWITLAVVSCMGIVVCIVFGKKRKTER